ncbi:MAG: DUF6728 family protein [Bacteroidota bacterium]
MSRLKEQFKLGEAFSYFIRVFQKPDPSKPNNLNIRMMHGINRISIVMFLIALIVIIYRLATR